MDSKKRKCFDLTASAGSQSASPAPLFAQFPSYDNKDRAKLENQEQPHIADTGNWFCFVELEQPKHPQVECRAINHDHDHHRYGDQYGKPAATPTNRPQLQVGKECLDLTRERCSSTRA
ncbi:hypothetical protein UA08_05949 [Talaromyces atroroseus]|uniref:Uncharacterized protein n=1 Tax=Talaromyces atroroseus TaxID=1441469 RepID=A0A225AD82_TALAT|nr:hypothetical protein UA08_05949 [Talaromyces atroroseus]OKL59131.1 hypothetical protein UA08_05949 [Talaromyces atroroseus]